MRPLTVLPGVIVPAFITAPATFALTMKTEVTDWPAALVTVMTFPVTEGPALGAALADFGSAKSKADTAVVAKSEAVW
ncbi:MAG: hypothetical protein JO137_08240 [Hyphomicrobiales bacterium]|nr:hypothetical protein [Hyphomicrobiales bacterium]